MNRTFKSNSREKIDLKFFNVDKEVQTKKLEKALFEVIKDKAGEMLRKKKFIDWSIHYNLFLTEYELIFNVLNKVLEKGEQDFNLIEKSKFRVVLAHIFSPLFFKKECDEDVLVLQSFRQVVFFQLEGKSFVDNKRIIENILMPYFLKHQEKDRQGLMKRFETINKKQL